MASDSIVGYTFNADVFCSGCMARGLGWDGGGDPTEFIDQRGRDKGFVREDFYDSGEWPKVIFEHQCDSDERCGNCGGELR
jgi:hypothetical protein